MNIVQTRSPKSRSADLLKSRTEDLGVDGLTADEVHRRFFRFTE